MRETAFWCSWRSSRRREQIFSDYAYFSSYSSSWLEHCRRYAEQMIERLGLDERKPGRRDRLQRRLPAAVLPERQIPVLGIEPAANVAEVALAKGHSHARRVLRARDRPRRWPPSSAADLLLGNNVLAHVPDLNDFVAGMKILLKPGGVITMEFPHLMRLIEENQWDTIYHEHFSYFSFLTVSRVFEAHGLRLFDVEELPTHGGSLRVYGATPRTARSPSSEARTRAARARARRRVRAARDLSRLRPPRRAGQAPDPGLSDRSQGAGSAGRRLRRARRRATRCSTTAACGATSSTTRAT